MFGCVDVCATGCSNAKKGSGRKISSDFPLPIEFTHGDLFWYY